MASSYDGICPRDLGESASAEEKDEMDEITEWTVDNEIENTYLSFSYLHLYDPA